MLPIYLNLGTVNTNLPAILGIGAYVPVRSVHVSSIVTPVVLTGLLLRGAGLDRRYVSIAFAYGAWLYLSVVAGFMSGEEPELLFVFQTMLPLLAFLLGASLDVEPSEIAATVLRASIGATILVVVALTRGSVVLIGSNSVDEVIPQFKIYFPMVTVVGAAAAVVLVRSKPALVAAFIGSQVLLLPWLWSRTGFAMAGVAGTLTYLVQPPADVSSGGRTLRRAITVLVLLPVVLMLAVLALEGTVLATRVSASGFSTGRRDLLMTGIERVVAKPIFGDSFIAVDPTLYSRPTSKVLLYPSHNQYLEFALRGGLPALAMMIRFYGLIAADIRRVLSRRGAAIDAAALSAGILAAMLVGSGFNLYLTQPYSASICLFVLGLTARACSHRDRSAALQPGEGHLIRVGHGSSEPSGAKTPI